ncbi:hypothetical protein AAHE18_11G215800 [Arachis hypogaea]
MSFTSLVLLAKSKISIHSYFDSRNRVLLDGFLGGLMSFVLFWTYPSRLQYLVVHLQTNLFNAINLLKLKNGELI